MDALTEDAISTDAGCITAELTSGINSLKTGYQLLMSKTFALSRKDDFGPAIRN